MTGGEKGKGDLPGGLTYAAAGVDIEAADQAVDAMRDLVASTARPEVVGGIGGFGGLFAVPSGYAEPLLVASTDGVGTKIAVAVAAGRLDTIGIDLVAMCVDDLVCSGAEPLFFLDYQLLGKIDPDQVRTVMTGIAEGCRQAGCAILGGELAEHPGLLGPGELDIAGFAVGIVERSRVIDGRSAGPGDVVIGLPSPGLRSNGYSLARRALLEVAARPLDAPAWDGASSSVADELLRPSIIYSPAVLALLRSGVEVRAVAHITGGGIPANLPRVLPASIDALLDRSSWDVPRIFSEIQAAGVVSDDEMARVFNLGIGMTVVVPAQAADEACRALRPALARAGAGQEARVIGRLTAGTGRVRFA